MMKCSTVGIMDDCEECKHGKDHEKNKYCDQELPGVGCGKCGEVKGE